MILRILGNIVLGLIYFIVITPVSLLMRLFGRDKLMMRKRNVKTYWIDTVPEITKMSN